MELKIRRLRMADEKIGHFTKLPINSIKENVDADPKEPCTEAEVVSYYMI